MRRESSDVRSGSIRGWQPVIAAAEEGTLTAVAINNALIEQTPKSGHVSVIPQTPKNAA